MIQNALPHDYVRPSLEEYLAASKTHTKENYLPFMQGHEDELRKYAAPRAPVEAEPLEELAELDADLLAGDEPPEAPEHYDPRAALTPTATEAEAAEQDDTRPMGRAPEVDPRAHLATPSGLPANYVRPSVAEWQAAGYERDLTGADAEAAHKKFFDDYEAKTQDNSGAADPASGELSASA